MEAKLLKKLEDNLLAKGLSKGLAKFVNVENEREIDGVVAEFESLTKKEEGKTKTFDELLGENKAFQAEFDRRITKATDKVRNKLPDPVEPNATPPETGDDKLAVFMAKMEERMDSMSATISNKSKSDQIKELVSSSKIPASLQESWIKRIDINSEVAFQDQITGLEQEYTALEQSIVDNKQLGGSPPIGGSGKEGLSADEIDDIITIN